MLEEALIVVGTVGVLLVGVVAGCAPILLAARPRRPRSCSLASFCTGTLPHTRASFVFGSSHDPGGYGCIPSSSTTLSADSWPAQADVRSDSATHDRCASCSGMQKKSRNS